MNYEQILPYIEKKLISEQSHPEDPDVRIFNYTQVCQYEKAWDDVTRNCRGLIMNVKTGEVLARPFPKFFNYQEHLANGWPIPDGEPVITEKMDGSLGILYVLNDKPRTDIIEKLQAHREDGHEVIFVSGRPERCRRDTLHWMWKNHVVRGGEEPVLFMRQDGDHRPDTQTKGDIYDMYLVNYPIEQIYDDRPSVIRMWREKGMNVEDVGNGIEF